MQIKSFDYFYNKEKTKKCLILGGAPSVKNIDYENFDGVIISMGDITPIKKRCRVDYWIIANSEFPLPYVHCKIINETKDTTFLFAHSALGKVNYNVVSDEVNKKLKVPWFAYDQRHFGGRSCNQQIDYRFHWKKKLECCDCIGDITIQEFLQDKYNTIGHYSTASTVAIHALALAIILGCKTIYVGGIDIPVYEKDYVYYGSSPIMSVLKNMRYLGIKSSLIKIIDIIFGLKRKSVFYPDIPEILKDFEYLNNLCKSNNIDLYNLSKTSNLRKIPNFKYMSPDRISR